MWVILAEKGGFEIGHRHRPACAPRRSVRPDTISPFEKCKMNKGEGGIRPAALGQCRRQPGELKNHSLDGFFPATGGPFPSHPSFFYAARKRDRKCDLFFVAEKEGFEPSRQSPQPTPLAGEPLTATWVLLHIQFLRFWRRERDSNPRCLSASLVFKTSAFNRSAISPRCGTSERYYNSFRPARQSSFFKKYGFSEILS